jgi:hypothetical protein
MPQPASRVKWNGNYQFGTETLTARPEFSGLVAAVIAGWAMTETHLGRTFAVLIGAKQPVTMTMYEAVRSFDVQRRLLLVAASEVLPKRYATLMDAALTVLIRAAQDRHKFAHWVWGASADPELDALLLVEPKHFWNLIVARIRRRNQLKIEWTAPHELMMQGSTKLNPEHIFVYRLKDLHDTRDRMERAYRIAEALRQLADSNGSRRRVIYRWLCGEPDIRQALDRVRKVSTRSPPTSRAQHRKQLRRAVVGKQKPPA